MHPTWIPGIVATSMLLLATAGLTAQVVTGSRATAETAPAPGQETPVTLTPFEVKAELPWNNGSG